MNSTCTVFKTEIIDIMQSNAMAFRNVQSKIFSDEVIAGLVFGTVRL